MKTEELKQFNSLNERDEISIKEVLLQIGFVFKYLFSRWLIILLVGLSGAIGGFFYASSRGTLYKATTTFVLEDGVNKGGMGQYAGLAAMAGINIGGGGGLFTADNIIELYKSRNMIKKALLSSAKFNGRDQLLINRYIEFNGLKEKWSKNPKIKDISFIPNQEFTILQDSLLNSIVININSSNLFVDYLEKTKSILKVEVKDADALFAKAFNESIVATVNNFYVQTKAKRSLENLVILQHQVDSVKAVLNGSITSGAAIVDGTPNLNQARQILRAPVERFKFNAETNKVILSELVKNLEISKISVRQEVPLIQVIDSPVLPLETERLSKTKGIIIGGILSGFLIIFILSSIFFYKKIMSSE